MGKKTKKDHTVDKLLSIPLPDDIISREDKKADELSEEQYDQLLREFIESNDADNDLEFQEIQIYITPTEEWELTESNRTQFSVDEGKFIHASAVCLGTNIYNKEVQWTENFSVELISPEGDTCDRVEISSEISTEDESLLNVSFDLSQRESLIGDWKIRFTRLSDKNNYKLKEFTILPFSQQYNTLFELNNYLLFRLDEDTPSPDQPAVTYTSIDPKKHNNYYIGLCCITKQKGEELLKEYEYALKIKNATGLTEYYTTGRFVTQKDEEGNILWAFQEPVDFEDYNRGEYSVEIYFLGKKIINAPFRIGDEQVGEYNLFTIQTCPPIGEKKEINPAGEKDAMDSLQEMIGLDSLKQNITEHLNYVKLLNARKKAGLKASIPPLHMIFTGNPGTGKTTVADFIGEIFHKMGLLEKGHVIRTDRSKLVGKWLGETEQKTEAAIEAAKGGVLFIDEAYSLFTNDKDGDKRDFGNRVIETLLPKLSDDNFGTIVILAGYPAEMKLLMESNPGLQSRFPFTFHFEDYTPEELLEIAELTTRREGYRFTDEAREALFALIKKEYKTRDRHFGNARFVNRIISSQILPAMATRLANDGIYEMGNPDLQLLTTIERTDIPNESDEKELILSEKFDEQTIEQCLARLDRMIGLNSVKKAIHNFVKVARMLRENGKNFFGEIPLKWSFSGNTGTGKSTVAEIMADLLKAMNILDNGQFVEIKGEQLYNIPDYRVDEVLEDAMKRSQQGLLFIDGDSPKFKNTGNTFDTEQLRIKLAQFTSSLPGTHALIIAENQAPRQELVELLIDNGAPEIDHTLIFEDYSQEELLDILKQMLSDKGFAFEQEAETIMRRYIKYLASDRYSCYANARTMKIVSQTIIQNIYVRLSDTKNQSPQTLILPSDVDCFEINDKHKYISLNRIGFY